MSFKEAIARFREKTWHAKKDTFYTYDMNTFKISKYTTIYGIASLEERKGMITFFWAEEIAI